MTQNNQNKTTVSSATGKAQSAASDAAKTVKDTAREAVDAAQNEAKTRAESAKSSVAGEVSNVASALRTAADEMRSGSPQERTFGQIAEGLADASEAIRQKDLGEVARDLSDFARRNPLVFLGGAALVGFAATRFAKASAETREDETRSRTPAGSYQGGHTETAGARVTPRPATGDYS